ncbi:hypothetical protein ACVBGC_15495 [Burkholderia stagnalis]
MVDDGRRSGFDVARKGTAGHDADPDVVRLVSEAVVPSIRRDRKPERRAFNGWVCRAFESTLNGASLA